MTVQKTVLCVLICRALISAGEVAPETGDAHVLRVGTKVAPPFAMKSKEGQWSGISIDLRVPSQVNREILKAVTDRAWNRFLNRYLGP